MKTALHQPGTDYTGKLTKLRINFIQRKTERSYYKQTLPHKLKVLLNNVLWEKEILF
jgi:hypothetical protein